MENLTNIVYIDKTEFPCKNQFDYCGIRERTLSFALGVALPEEPIDYDEVFKECCYKHFVFADANSELDYKNDYSGFYHQRQLPNETADFYLLHVETATELPLVDSTYGSFFDFGYFTNNTNLKGYRVEWKKVLEEIGEGSFKIIKRYTIAGISLEVSSYVFILKQFSNSLADKTVRIDIVMNGRIELDGVEFKGTNWKHSLRLPGFFGRRNPKFEEDNLIGLDYEERQISMTQTNEYKFQTNLIPYCFTQEIFDFMLYANDIYINDYNLNNHSYGYIKKGVKFANNEEPIYSSLNRKAKLNLTFKDKFANRIKRNF